MRKSLILFLSILLFESCIDRLVFDVGESEIGVLVVDGQITDEPGPYTVKLFRSSSADDVLNWSLPAPVKKVYISSNEGDIEELKEVDYGIYQTSTNGIRGRVGNSYKIRIELNDGRIFESIQEELKPSGTFDSLYWEYETFEPSDAPTQYGFRLFVNAHNLPGEDNFVRWKFKGTYKVETNPELHRVPCGVPEQCPDPRPCSGVIWYKGLYLKKLLPCECCTCWINQYEQVPTIRDNSLVVQGSHRKVEVGFVPMNEWTFFSNKYLVEVKQMSLTKSAFEFLKTIKDQKEGATSLFQPSYGKARTNIFQVNGDNKALGFFYASSVKRKLLWITSKDVPISIPVPLLKVKESCLQAFPNSYTEQPDDWN